MKSLAFLILLLSFSLPAQQLKTINSTPLEAERFIGIDSYKNTYYLKDMVLHKTGPLGTFSFRDYQLGPVSSVDMINPLNVVVFYSEVNTVLLLDNRLNEVQRINFNNLPEFVNISFAGNAGNNRLWIFNVDSQQLELYNYRTGFRTVISQPLTEAVTGMVSDFNFCYVLTSEGIKKYNIYGSFIQALDETGLTQIVQQNGRLIGVKSNKILMLNMQSSSLENLIRPLKLPIPENTIKDLQLTQEFLYIYDGLNIHSITLTQPKQ